MVTNENRRRLQKKNQRNWDKGVILNGEGGLLQQCKIFS